MTPHEKYLDLSLGRARYLEAGSGEPLLLLHGVGLGNSADSFAPIIPLLAQRYRVLALDQLGFGMSNRQVEDGPTFELNLQFIREFMDVLGLPAAHVAGHSMGGWMGALLAYESPDRVKTLAMLNAAGLNAQAAAGVGQLPGIPTVEQLVEQVRREFKYPERAREDFLLAMAQSRHRMFSQPNALHSLDALFRQMQTPTLRARYLLHRRLPHIRVPTLVLWGTGDAMDPYPTWTAEYESLKGDMSKSGKPWVIPGARYVLVDTGHYSHWEIPDETVHHVIDSAS